MTDAGTTLPLWLEIIVAVLVLSGAGLALLGSSGLLRLPTFFERVHAPSIIATLGCWLIMHGTVLYFSVADRSLALHALLIAVFPANIHMAMNPQLYPDTPLAALLIRLPLQGLLIAVAFWFTRGAGVAAKSQPLEFSEGRTV